MAAICRVWAAAAMIAAGCAVMGCANGTEGIADNGLQTGENQRWATVMVTDITGNELTYIEINNDDTKEYENGGESAAGVEIGGEKAGENGNYEVMENGHQGELPEGLDEMLSQTGGNEMGPEAAEQFAGGKGDEEQQKSSETQIQIPVGIPVYTPAGAETAIAGIKNGDILQILFEAAQDGTQTPVEIRIQ